MKREERERGKKEKGTVHGGEGVGLTNLSLKMNL